MGVGRWKGEVIDYDEADGEGRRRGSCIEGEEGGGGVRVDKVWRGGRRGR